MIPRYAVISTRNRARELGTCIRLLYDQADRIVVVDNHDMPTVHFDLDREWEGLEDQPHWSSYVDVIFNPMQPPNLSTLWNEGLWAITAIHSGRTSEYDVAIINDDAVIPYGWYETMSNAMRANGCAAACQSPFGGPMKIWGPEATPSVHTRLTGWAFVLRGELGLRFDPQFQWWCGDDDMSVRSRNHGGLVHVPGFMVENTRANESTAGVLAEIAAADMQRFVDKHGRRPW